MQKRIILLAIPIAIIVGISFIFWPRENPTDTNNTYVNGNKVCFGYISEYSRQYKKDGFPFISRMKSVGDCEEATYQYQNDATFLDFATGALVGVVATFVLVVIYTRAISKAHR